MNLKLFPYLHGFEQKASGPNWASCHSRKS
jgi:hypothetical protein